MDGEMLKVAPATLQAASGATSVHAAQMASAAGSLSGSAEMSGLAAAALHSAFSGYCREYSQRLSSMSAALLAVAGSYTAMEQTNRDKLASIAPGSDALVPEM